MPVSWVISWPAITKYKVMAFSWAMFYFIVGNSTLFHGLLKNFKTYTIHGFFMMSAKPMNFKNVSFMGHENQFMVFSWLFHDVGFYSEP